MGDGMAAPAAGGGGPFGSYATKKHPSWKKADKAFKKNSLIKMYYGTEKTTKGKDQLVKEAFSFKMSSRFFSLYNTVLYLFVKI